MLFHTPEPIKTTLFISKSDRNLSILFLGSTNTPLFHISHAYKYTEFGIHQRMQNFANARADPRSLVRISPKLLRFACDINSVHPPTTKEIDSNSRRKSGQKTDCIVSIWNKSEQELLICKASGPPNAKDLDHFDDKIKIQKGLKDILNLIAKRANLPDFSNFRKLSLDPNHNSSAYFTEDWVNQASDDIDELLSSAAYNQLEQNTTPPTSPIITISATLNTPRTLKRIKHPAM
ncbi:hypothetical protein G9A89_009270 [Geosiphon pyriformis]|nr:hypothetical protein G9A89_009270 [Geosiphon pyriformis]